MIRSIPKWMFFVVGLLLAGVILVACSAPAEAPKPVVCPTAAPCPTAVAAVAPTAVPTKAPAPVPTATPAPLTAAVDILNIAPVQAIRLPRTDVATLTQQVYTSGLNVVPPGGPQYVKAVVEGVIKDSKLTYAWTIVGPTASSAVKIEAVPASAANKITEGTAKFTPDQLGRYLVSVKVSDDKNRSVTSAIVPFQVSTYVGSAQCMGCHKNYGEEFKNTAHASIFTNLFDGKGKYAAAEGERYRGVAFVGSACAYCHTVGFMAWADPKTSNGGFFEMVTRSKTFKWPTVSKPAAGDFDRLPPEIKAVANIGCENCHGPGAAHVKTQDKDYIAFSQNSGNCDQCHDAGGHHTKGTQFNNSGHAKAGELGEGERADCATCHAPEGFINRLAGKLAGPAEDEELACSTCHDPHSDKNKYQLRVAGAVSDIPYPVKDVGLSAVCIECHNGRRQSSTVDTAAPSYPHYSAAAEQIYKFGGYEFGLKIPNTEHNAMITGATFTWVLNTETTEIVNGKDKGACVICHMAPTPGGTWDTADSLKVAGHNTLGSHSFTMSAKGADGKQVDFVEPCLKCHPGKKSFAEFTAAADYDGNGKPEALSAEIKGLLAQLKKALEDKGVKSQDGNPYFVAPANPSVEIKAGIWNYRYVAGVMWTGEGKAASVHNPKRAIALLQASIWKLTGKELATPLYQK